MIRNPRILRAISLFLLVQFVTQLFFPGISYALTSGPSQPEFSSFEPVSSTNMVDEFSGKEEANLMLNTSYAVLYASFVTYNIDFTSEEAGRSQMILSYHMQGK
jgi:hypothetical protein